MMNVVFGYGDVDSGDGNDEQLLLVLDRKVLVWR
jgi:hypothetical protein